MVICKFLGWKIATILLEKHKKGCTCSYCKGDNKIHYGQNIPPSWNKWNAWYVIKLFPRTYFRWTNTWFKFFTKKKIREKL